MQNAQHPQVNQRRSFDPYLLVLLAFLLGLLSVSISRLGTSYKVIEIGNSHFDVGLVAGAFGALAVFIAVPIGRAVDRFGERRFFLIGAGILLLSNVVAWASQSVAGLVVSQALLGLGQAGIALSTQTLAAHAPTALDADGRFAGVAMMQSISQLVGPLIGGAAIGTMAAPPLAGSGLAYLLGSLCSLVAMGIGLRTVRSSSRPRVDIFSTPVSILSILRGEGVAGALIASASVLVSIDILVAYLPVLGEERGMSPGFVGLLLAMRAGAGLLARPATTPLLHRFGRRGVLVGTLLLMALSMAAIPVSASPLLLLVALAVVGFGINLGAPLTASWMAAGVTPDAKGAALALRMSANRGAQIAVPALLGALASGAGTGALFLAMGAGLVLTSQLVRLTLRPTGVQTSEA